MVVTVNVNARASPHSDVKQTFSIDGHAVGTGSVVGEGCKGQVYEYLAIGGRAGREVVVEAPDLVGAVVVIHLCVVGTPGDAVRYVHGMEDFGEPRRRVEAGKGPGVGRLFTFVFCACPEASRPVAFAIVGNVVRIVAGRV